MPDAFSLNYIGPMSDRPRYHADDSSRDVLTLDPRTVEVENARLRTQPDSLAQAGFTLVPHASAVADFRDPAALATVYRSEMQQLLLELTGAHEVVFSALPVCRSTRGARLTVAKQLYSSRPGEFVHVDISDATAAALAKRCEPKHRRERVRRFAHYNLWRAFSPPPQDVPLAVCDARSVSPSDLVEADAVMDIPGKRESSYVGLVMRYNPRHRWSWFSHMNRDEILVFKAHDSDTGQPNQVPHTAFHDSTCPAGLMPRASIEMRGIAYWYER
jgi:hypothetical protein